MRDMTNTAAGSRNDDETHNIVILYNMIFLLHQIFAQLLTIIFLLYFSFLMVEENLLAWPPLFSIPSFIVFVPLFAYFAIHLS